MFSQFTGFLNLIEVALQRENIAFTRFDGSMDIKKRHEAIAQFKTVSRTPMVLLISLKAGGVGLNLTNANREPRRLTMKSELNNSLLQMCSW